MVQVFELLARAVNRLISFAADGARFVLGEKLVDADGPLGFVFAVQVLPVPVLAIGGITSERAPEIAQAGAAGLGAIGLFSSLAKSTPQEFCRSVDKIRKRWRT